jgi:hypothetical protein
MLHPFDDYPVHQAPTPLLHPATDSPNAYDRSFYNGFSPDGEVFFAVALGVYPNRRIMDAAFSVVRNGTQHNLRASRACVEDRTDTTVGPIAVEVIEPMVHHRISVDAPGHDLRAELVWRSASAVIEEPRFTHLVGAVTRLDYTRMTQFGSWSGWIDLDGERIEIDTGSVVGCRDRSWGIRSIGAPIPGPPNVPQFFWIWAPTMFDDACTHFALNHDADGRPWHQSGAITGRITDADLSCAAVLDPARVQRAERARADISWGPGTRWAESITTTLERFEADPIEISYQPILRFQMSGLGYLHPTWGHGMWRSELDVERDDIVLDDIDPAALTSVHIQALSTARWGDRTGVGIVEQLVLGPHTPTGLAGITDGA